MFFTIIPLKYSAFKRNDFFSLYRFCFLAIRLVQAGEAMNANKSIKREWNIPLSRCFLWEIHFLFNTLLAYRLMLWHAVSWWDALKWFPCIFRMPRRSEEHQPDFPLNQILQSDCMKKLWGN